MRNFDLRVLAVMYDLESPALCFMDVLQRSGNPQYFGKKVASDVENCVSWFVFYECVVKIWKSLVIKECSFPWPDPFS